MKTLDQLIQKHAHEQDVRKRAVHIRDDADALLDELANKRSAETGASYLDAYHYVTKTEDGARMLAHREDVSRFIESAINLASSE